MMTHPSPESLLQLQWNPLLQCGVYVASARYEAFVLEVAMSTNNLCRWTVRLTGHYTHEEQAPGLNRLDLGGWARCDVAAKRMAEGVAECMHDVLKLINHPSRSEIS